MEKYKANRNSDSDIESAEVPMESEKDKKEQSTEKAVDLAATVALDVYTGGQFSQVKNTISKVPVVGKAANDVWDRAVNKVSKVVSKTQVGDVAKELDDSGITDVAKQGYDAFGGQLTGSGQGNINTNNSNVNKTDNTSNDVKLNNKSNNTSSDSNGNVDELNNSSSKNDNGNIVKSIIKIPLKLLLIGLGAFIFILLLFFMIFFCLKDLQNLALTNHSVFSESSLSLRNCEAYEIEEKLVYVGDKRIDDIKNSLENTNYEFITNVSGGYVNFKNNILPSLENKLFNMNSGVVILSFDIYDLANFDYYLNDYEELINKYTNINFYVTGLGSVDDNLANVYGISNSLINEYNSKISTNFSGIYINYNSILGDFSTEDGIKYDKETNKKINDYIINIITEKGNIKCSNVGIEKLNEEHYNGAGASLLINGETVLSKIGQTEIDNLNSVISYDANKAGKRSGLAVTISAYDLIMGALNYGFIIPYSKGSQSISIGIDGSWGSSNGLDSYGFIKWAMINGGCSNFNSINSEALLKLGEEIEPYSSINGDLVVLDDHVMLILRNEGNKLIVAEANKEYGLIFASYYYSEIEKAKVVSLSDFYKNGCS